MHSFQGVFQHLYKKVSKKKEAMLDCTKTSCTCMSLLFSSTDDVPNFPIDHTHLQSLRGRVSLAKQVHIIEYRRDKSRRAEKWMTQTAESLGMDLDEGQLYPSCFVKRGLFISGCLF